MAPTLYGLGHALVAAVQLTRAGPAAAPHWSDFWCYGAMPIAVDAAIALALLSSFAWPGEGCFAVAAGLLAPLLTAIRNALDLVTWLAPRREGVNRQADTGGHLGRLNLRRGRA